MKSFMKLQKIIILVTLVAALIVSCKPSNLFPSPTPFPTAFPTPTSTPSPTPTEIPSPTVIPSSTATPTKSLMPLSKFEALVAQLTTPGEADHVPHRDYEENRYEGIPPGTKFADLILYATGESKFKNTSLGEVAMVRLMYRDKNGELQDVWMMYAGSSFGVNKDGYNNIQAQNGNYFGPVFGSPEELLKLVKPGSKFSVLIPIRKGAGDTVPEIINMDWGGTTNELARESYRTIELNQADLQLLLSGEAVSPEFILIPYSFTILQ